jgi:hypothetical protein
MYRIRNFNILSKYSPTPLLLILLAFGTGCSHVNPYYRSDDLKPANISIAKEQIKSRILLIGDAGQTQKNDLGLARLLQWASLIPEKTTLIFLGDNIYPAGLPTENNPSRKEAERRLMAQINVIQQSEAAGVFIPGNHDWADNGLSGRIAVRREADFINRILTGEDNFLPMKGCAEPAIIDVDGARIILLDTHIWYEDEPEKIFTDCPTSNPREVFEQLKQIIADTSPDLKIVVVGHHPLVSFGPRGGHFFWKDHLFPLTRLVHWLWIPLPGIGSLYPLARSTFMKDRNDQGSAYHQRMKAHLTEAFSQHKPLIYAAGHDHTLQVLGGGPAADYLIVSGAGSQDRLYDVGHGDETLFAHRHAGFMAIDFLDDGRILLRAVEPGDTEVLFELWLDESK